MISLKKMHLALTVVLGMIFFKVSASEFNIIPVGQDGDNDCWPACS